MRIESKEERTKRARTVKGIPTVVSLFTGAGGMDLGFQMAGFRVLLASDIEEVAERTHNRNWAGVPFIRKDARTLEVDEIVQATKGRRPDVLVAGPPCQGFSTLGARLSADPRNMLVDEVVRVATALRPQAIVIENVAAISTEYKGRYRNYVIQRFEEIGYRMHFKVLDAAAYGVPQHRKRAFFIGFANRHIDYEYPEPTHGPGLLPYKTVGDAIMDLAEKGDEVANHTSLVHSDKVIARYRLVPEGGMLPPPDQLPEEIRRSNFGSTYKRLSRQRPSLTIVPGNNALPIHPTLDRSLTPREAARLQSFPDAFVFEGDRRRQCILVGQAVPPDLAKALAQSVAERIHAFSGAMANVSAVSIEPVLHSSSQPLQENKTKEISASSNGFVDLFCGAGGFTTGFQRAGFSPLVCVDIDKSVRASHEVNFPDVPFIQGDISLLDVQDEIARLAGPEPFIMVGGPPCQGFSVFGKRRFARTKGHDPRKDPRNKLVFSFVDMAARLRPRWVVMENVAGFATLDDGSFVERVVEELRELGYSQIEHRVLDAADYGVPQHRRRFLLIANRTGHVIPWPKKKFFENPKDWQTKFRTVGEAITDLASEESFSKHTCHSPMNHKPLVVERYRHIPEGGKLDVGALPPELLAGYRTDTVKNFSHVYKRLHRGQPSITLVPGHNAFPVHPWLNRTLTVREAARIQTFPDNMVFVGARQDQCIQVGNAFPPLLAELIANNISKAETSGWYPGNLPKLALYSLIEPQDDPMSKQDKEISMPLFELADNDTVANPSGSRGSRRKEA